MKELPSESAPQGHSDSQDVKDLNPIVQSTTRTSQKTLPPPDGGTRAEYGFPMCRFCRPHYDSKHMGDYKFFRHIPGILCRRPRASPVTDIVDRVYAVHPHYVLGCFLGTPGRCRLFPLDPRHWHFACLLGTVGNFIRQRVLAFHAVSGGNRRLWDRLNVSITQPVSMDISVQVISEFAG